MNFLFFAIPGVFAALAFLFVPLGKGAGKSTASRLGHPARPRTLPARTDPGPHGLTHPGPVSVAPGQQTVCLGSDTHGLRPDPRLADGTTTALTCEGAAPASSVRDWVSGPPSTCRR